ncbi:hypothetical protein TNCV_2811271 [Trichonephila clavipes]|nr:hypothetical protein TNCV_2811271 [Trichonephila clavipes]
MSTIQCCVTRCIQGLHAHRREEVVRTGHRIGQLTIYVSFSTSCEIRSPLSLGADVIVFEEGFHQPIKRIKQSVFLDVTVFRHTLVD